MTRQATQLSKMLYKGAHIHYNEIQIKTNFKGCSTQK